MKEEKIAVLDTSSARDIKWNPDGNSADPENIKASNRLMELLDEGYKVYIVSTRTKMYPDSYDKCLFDVVPEEQIFHAEPGSEVGHACAAGLVDVYKRLYTVLGFEFPEVSPNSLNRGREDWTDYRSNLANLGVVLR
tara:strand:- start:2118 stop:2528 length:411 start_codon:yes stop_codon:yes gene_type:complete